MTDSVSYAFDDEVATAFFGALATGLAPTGLALSLISSVTAADRVPARDVPMDGAIVYSCQDDSEALGWLRRRGLPLVYVDQPPEESLSTINVDDRGGARQAAQHLVDLGHRRRRRGPADAARRPRRGPRPQPPRVLRAGQGLGRRPVPVGINPVVRPASHRDEAAYDVVRDLLDRPDRPTALLCYSDVMAFWAVRAAEDLGLRVPEDLSVVGFDDNPLARRMRPELTTVRQDVRAKGRAAAAALTEAIAGAIAGCGGIRAMPARHETLPDRAGRPRQRRGPASDRDALTPGGDRSAGGAGLRGAPDDAAVAAVAGGDPQRAVGRGSTVRIRPKRPRKCRRIAAGVGAAEHARE